MDVLPQAENSLNTVSQVVYGSVEGAKWSCPACTFENSSDVSACEMCQTERQSGAQQVAIDPTNDDSCHLCWEPIAVRNFEPNLLEVDFENTQENTAQYWAVANPGVQLGCNHICCRDCLGSWINARLGEGKTHIPCPVCPVPDASSSTPPVQRLELPIAVVMHCAGIPTARKLLKFRHERTLEAEGNTFWCTNRNCGQAFALKGTRRRVACDHCSAASCRKCKKPYHVWPICSGYDPSLAAWEAEAIARGREVKACPGCKRKTEREGGCLNITCTCGQRYCWVCLMAWPCPNGCGLKKGHDGDRNAQGAPLGLVGARQMYLRRMGCCGLAVIGASIVGALIAGVYAIVLAVCILCCPCIALAKCGRLCRRKWQTDLQWMDEGTTNVCIIFTVILLSPLGVAAALVCAIPGVFYLLYVIIFGAFVDTGFRRSLYGPMMQLQGDQPWLPDEAPIYKDYKGPLPAKLVVTGKVGLVVLWLCFSLPIGFVVCLAWAPLAPCFLLPVCVYPRLTTNKWAKFFVTLVSVAAAVLLFLYLPPYLSLPLRWIISVAVFVMGLGIAIRTPTSDWAFLGPLWQGALAPCATILGFKNPVNPENNPFTGPVPFPGPYFLAFEEWNGHIAL